MNLKTQFFAAALITISSAVIHAAEPAIPVNTAPAVTVQNASPRRYAGMIEAVQKVEIMPRVTGELREIKFKEGAMVNKGELLFVLEDTTYKAAVDALEARKEQLTAQVEFMTKEFKRYEELVASNAAAVSTFDRSLFELNSARAQLKEIEASLVDAKNLLSYTRISAPIAGRIGKSTFTVGNLITPGGKKLADIEMLSPINIRFAISETVLLRDFGGREGFLKNGFIKIRLADGSEYPESAKITLIDNHINPTTNTITCWAEFKNENQQLTPGGYVTVSLFADSKAGFTAIPPSALVVTGKEQGVFVVGKDNKVTFRTVVTGGVSGKLLIIKSGIAPGENVVTEGSHKLKNGMTVNPIPMDK